MHVNGLAAIPSGNGRKISETIDDPGVFNKVFTITINAALVPDTEILEYVCLEKEKDRQHFAGTPSDSIPPTVKVAPEVLARYVGTYEFAYPENPTVPGTFNVTMADGTLFLDTEGRGRTPLNRVSETVFYLRDARIEFVKDARGAVTSFKRAYVEGSRAVSWTRMILLSTPRATFTYRTVMVIASTNTCRSQTPISPASLGSLS